MSESELRSEDSLQPVKYLGRACTLYAHGIGVAIEPARVIWRRSKKGSHYYRCALSIHPFGLCIYEEIATGTYKSVWVDAIENISYCVAEPLHRHLFAWIARSTYSNKLECHVVLCKTRKQSRLLAELLAKAFYESYHSGRQRMMDLTSDLSTRCSVCDTMARQQNINDPSSLLGSRCHCQCDGNIEEQQGNDDFQHNSFPKPKIARAIVQSYEENSINNTSRLSTDYDTILPDDEPIHIFQYYRK